MVRKKLCYNRSNKRKTNAIAASMAKRNHSRFKKLKKRFIVGSIKLLCLQRVAPKALRLYFDRKRSLLLHFQFETADLFTQIQTYNPIMGMVLDTQRMYFYRFTTTF